MLITLQYLEDSPDLLFRQRGEVITKLHAAADLLPLSHLLIGWHLPAPLLEACRLEAERLGLRFLRWHPLLTGDAVFQAKQDWQVEGANGSKVPGHRGMPEFTFVCPNHPGVQEEISRRLEQLVGEGIYQGFFLDRIRFPSPSRHPIQDLGCFCEYCRQRALSISLDLEQVRESIKRLGSSPQGQLALIEVLLGMDNPETAPENTTLLQAFLDFREQSVTDFAARLSQSLRASGMEIGLDCFTPSLTRMVGQSLNAFGSHADWIKLMSYAHTLGPAGIPFELLGFVDHLTQNADLHPVEILRVIGSATRIDLPRTRKELKEKGISSSSLGEELQRGKRASTIPILAGFELVEIAGVAELNEGQILADLEAIRQAGVAGLSISWDLWDIPLDRIGLVRKFVTV